MTFSQGFDTRLHHERTYAGIVGLLLLLFSVCCWCLLVLGLA
jgi:hypothetical protein